MSESQQHTAGYVITIKLCIYMHANSVEYMLQHLLELEAKYGAPPQYTTAIKQVTKYYKKVCKNISNSIL